MKTITLSISEDIWRHARIEAAKRNTNLSAIVRRYLRALVEGNAPVFEDDNMEDAARRNRKKLSLALQSADLVLDYTPSREKTYER